MPRKISNSGIKLIKKFEGCRLSAYQDAVGVITIGYGWTKPIDGNPLTMDTKITQSKAESLLKKGLEAYESKVNKYDAKYRFNQNQFDALVSFAYNIGSIDQLTANGTRSISAIAEKIPAYNKAGGRTLSGLTERRKAEQALFMQPVREQKPIQAASIETGHVQLDYKQGKQYQITVSGLRIRTKRAGQSPAVLPNGGILGTAKQGSTVKNLATARVGDQIWMYIGLDKLGREQWVCADTGEEAYIR